MASTEGIEGHLCLQAALEEFQKYKTLGEKTFSQLEDEDLSWRPHAEANSIVMLVQHLEGNMRSRWTDFFTTDGEKPDRQRDREFAGAALSRQSMLDTWNGGWACLFDALGAMSAADLGRTVTIRGEPHTVSQAILRQLSHYAYHVGQMVYVAKLLKRDAWQTLSIPRGRSADYLSKPHREA